MPLQSSSISTRSSKPLLKSSRSRPSENAPRIGILTQPWDVKTDGDAFDEYVLDINKEFIELHGSVPVHISYLSDTDEDNAMLYSMLD